MKKMGLRGGSCQNRVWCVGERYSRSDLLVATWAGSMACVVDRQPGA